MNKKKKIRIKLEYNLNDIIRRVTWEQINFLGLPAKWWKADYNQELGDIFYHSVDDLLIKTLNKPKTLIVENTIEISKLYDKDDNIFLYAENDNSSLSSRRDTAICYKVFDNENMFLDYISICESAMKKFFEDDYRYLSIKLKY